MVEASNTRGSSAGVVLITPEGEVLEQAITLGFSTSNKEAKYEATLAGFQLAHHLGAKHLIIHSDS